MFKNRSVQVKLVNDKDVVDANEAPKTTPAEYAAIARDLGKDAIKGAVVLVGAYMLADTLRQVTVQNTKFNKN